ncbi:MAG TPA: protein-L-isoaspartate O-methyltransferase, partial [Planctomycetes bacterium]|nr:protein-L-isoaspartate O-methyltransferase [Planctomycetota bacterium]
NGVHGLPDHAPFDAILVSAAFPYTPPDLLDQLALDGRLVAPIGGGKSQTLRVLTAKPERIQAEQDLMTVRFVPLIP